MQHFGSWVRRYIREILRSLRYRVVSSRNCLDGMISIHCAFQAGSKRRTGDNEIPFFPFKVSQHGVYSQGGVRYKNHILSFGADEVREATPNLLQLRNVIDAMEKIRTGLDGDIEVVAGIKYGSGSRPVRSLSHILSNQSSSKSVSCLPLLRLRYAGSSMKYLRSSFPKGGAFSLA